jgi:hypothetical protein
MMREMSLCRVEKVQLRIANEFRPTRLTAPSRPTHNFTHNFGPCCGWRYPHRTHVQDAGHC